jgi:hypothetical protein
MADLGSDGTDVYTLSMSYDLTAIGRGQLKNGTFGYPFANLFFHFPNSQHNRINEAKLRPN